VTRHAGGDAERQGDALTRLRTRAGRSRTQVAYDLGIEADTYRRYETGQTELRVNQVEPFAKALGTTPDVLLQALGFDVGAAPARTLRAVLEAAGLDEDDIQEAESEVDGKNPSRASYRHIAEMLEARAIRRQNERQRANS
jgi:transcriptional regulator with XRE-family HTH domain